jgi:hypothetical protein
MFERDRPTCTGVNSLLWVRVITETLLADEGCADAGDIARRCPHYLLLVCDCGADDYCRPAMTPPSTGSTTPVMKLA